MTCSNESLMAWMTFRRSGLSANGRCARLFRQWQSSSLLQEARLTASADLDRAEPMYDADRALFHEFFTSRARYLGFTQAALIREDGETLEKRPISRRRASRPRRW